MALGGLIVGAYNAVALLEIGTRFMTIWGLAFGVGVPIVGIAQAWFESRKQPPGPGRSRLAAATLSGVILAEAAMLPLGESLRECRAATGER